MGAVGPTPRGTTLALPEHMAGRLLIVEDEAVLRKHLGRLFEREGYEVVTAGSLAEAIERLAADRFDALLLDIMLPDGDGLDVLAALDPCQRPRRTMVMTAFSTPENEARAHDLSVDRLLRKPLDLPQLVRIVRGGAAARRA
jgi:two-component system, NtrC family, response regulator PilR